jgi:glycosyltransferase involved in cell wall biosynthesis
MPTRGRLRVFHLIKSLGRGGAEMLLVDGPPLSDPNRFEYRFGYFLPWKNALVPDIAANFGDVACFSASNPGAILARTFDVARCLEEWDADLIHCHLPLASIVGRLAGAIAKVPVVTTEHNLYERYHPVTRLASLATWRLHHGVIAVSHEVAASIARHAGKTVPIRVVQNGLSVGRFRREEHDGAAARAAIGVEPDAPLVGTVAVFRVQKRLDSWLLVADRVRRRHPRARFVIVGDGPLKKEVQAGIDRLGLADCVKLTGLLDDVRPLLAAMDVYLMSSDFEGLPIALLEAMAMQVPPVATAVGGIPEVLSRDAGGTVVPKGDVAGLASGVEALLEVTETERRARGAAARQRVVEAFSSDRMMREIEGVYDEVLARG